MKRTEIYKELINTLNEYNADFTDKIFVQERFNELLCSLYSCKLITINQLENTPLPELKSLRK